MRACSVHHLHHVRCKCLWPLRVSMAWLVHPWLGASAQPSNGGRHGWHGGQLGQILHVSNGTLPDWCPGQQILRYLPELSAPCVADVHFLHLPPASLRSTLKPLCSGLLPEAGAYKHGRLAESLVTHPLLHEHEHISSMCLGQLSSERLDPISS
jgi:hypothetical protein